eukprot:scaffold10457_cov106-Isochrysis_galbana.AAC.4
MLAVRRLALCAALTSGGGGLVSARVTPSRSLASALNLRGGQLQACFFDFDGTLAQSEDTHRQTFSELLGFELTPDYWNAKCVGNSPREGAVHSASAALPLSHIWRPVPRAAPNRRHTHTRPLTCVDHPKPAAARLNAESSSSPPPPAGTKIEPGIRPPRQRARRLFGRDSRPRPRPGQDVAVRGAHRGGQAGGDARGAAHRG